MQYRGSAIELDIDVALTFSGTMCFELIRQNNDAPSPFRTASGAPRLGFNHWAMPTTHFDDDVARYQREGSSLVGSGKVVVGGRVAYLENPALPGLVELLEWTPRAHELFQMVRAASRDWDGKDPIRRLGGSRE